MKTATQNTTTRSSSLDEAEFLKKVEQRGLGFTDTLLAAPLRLLNANIDEVPFPARFVNRVHEANASTLVDLIRLHPEDMVGKNLGARTIEVATEELKKFFVKKINQPTLVTLRDMLRDFVQDFPARECRIFEMRMGLFGERHTLEAVGNKFGLTRERVRQIEAALIETFNRRYPAIRLIKENVKNGMGLSALVSVTGDLLQANDPLPLVGILETLEPKMHLVVQPGLEPIISARPQTDFTIDLRRKLDVVEEIFRASQGIILEHELESALKERLDSVSVALAMSKVRNEGVWMDKLLLSPNKDRTNIAIGILQAAPRPVHIETLAEEVKVFHGEEQSPEALRASLSLVENIRWFGYGMVGLSKHVPMSAAQIADLVAFCERVIQRGTSGYQWNVKDLLAKAQDKWSDINIEHNELNVILQDSIKLAYLGRQTWVLRGEHDIERKTYRDLFVSILTKAGKPLDEETLITRVKKQRGIHLKVHLKNESEVIEISPKVWGLTRRDNPFSRKELNTLTKAFDDSFGGHFTNEYLDKLNLNRHGLNASEIVKIIELDS